MTVPGQDTQIDLIETCTTLYLREWPLQGWNLCTVAVLSRYHLRRVDVV